MVSKVEFVLFLVLFLFFIFFNSCKNKRADKCFGRRRDRKSLLAAFDIFRKSGYTKTNKNTSGKRALSNFIRSRSWRTFICELHIAIGIKMSKTFKFDSVGNLTVTDKTTGTDKDGKVVNYETQSDISAQQLSRHLVMYQDEMSADELAQAQAIIGAQ